MLQLQLLSISELTCYGWLPRKIARGYIVFMCAYIYIYIYIRTKRPIRSYVKNVIISLRRNRVTNITIYIYIYIYCHPQTYYLVISQVFGVTRFVGRFKLYLVSYHSAILTTYISKEIITHFVSYILFTFCTIGYRSSQFVRRALHIGDSVYIYIYIYVCVCVCVCVCTDPYAHI